jgi:hypothetical protein
MMLIGSVCTRAFAAMAAEAVCGQQLLLQRTSLNSAHALEAAASLCWVVTADISAAAAVVVLTCSFTG